MSKKRFDRAFKKYLRDGEDKWTAGDFLAALARVARKRAKRIELKGKLVNGRVRFEPSPDVAVRGNEIVIGDQRIVVRVT